VSKGGFVNLHSPFLFIFHLGRQLIVINVVLADIAL